MRYRRGVRRAVRGLALLLAVSALAAPAASAQPVDDQIRDLRLEVQQLREELGLMKAEL